MIDGRRLRTLRKRQKITAEELGRILGVSGQQVLRYETAQSDMTTDTLVKIADFFDVSTDYLMGRADQPTPYEYRKGPLSWRIDTTGLLKTFEPEFIARLVRAMSLPIRPDQEVIKVSDLLKQHPPEVVAAFVKALGLNYSVVDDRESPSKDEP